MNKARWTITLEIETTDHMERDFARKAIATLGGEYDGESKMIDDVARDMAIVLRRLEDHMVQGDGDPVTYFKEAWNE